MAISLKDIDEILKTRYLSFIKEMMKTPPPFKVYDLPECSCGGVFVQDLSSACYICNVCHWVVSMMELHAYGRTRLFEKKIGRQGYDIDGIGVVV